MTDQRRDKYVPKTKTPAPGTPIAHPESFELPITGVHTGAELAELREHRPTNQRIGRLEVKHDKLDDIVRGIDRRLSNQDGQLDQLVQIGVRAEHREVEKAKLEVAKAKLDRPLKIIQAAFVGAVSIIVALKELL